MRIVVARPGERPDKSADPAKARPAEQDVQRNNRGQAPVLARPGDQRGHEVEGPEKDMEQDERHWR